MTKWIRLGFFLLLAVAQLYITFDVITTKEEVLDRGNAYKFNVAPVDPNDPFRGKYVTLRFRDNAVRVDYVEEWTKGDLIYVQVENDEDGIAQLVYGAKYAMDNGKDFFVATYRGKLNEDSVYIDYPFTRFYMEESKAPIAESIYRESVFNTNIEAYGVVKILHGEAVLEDIIVDNRSILDLVEEEQKETLAPSN